MKKISKFLLVVAIATGLVACNNDVPQPEETNGGGHYLGISLTMDTGSSSKATITDDSDPGLLVESELSAASAVVVAFPQGAVAPNYNPVVSNVIALAANYDATGAPTYTPQEGAAVEVPAGVYDVYVVVGPAAFMSTFKSEVTALPGIMTQKDLFSLLNNLQDIADLTTKNSFVMSSREKVSVTAQKTKPEAIAEANTAKVKLDRLTAKVMITAAAAMQVPSTFTAALANFTLEQGKPAEYTMMQGKMVPAAATFPTGITPLANDWNPASPVLAAPATAATGTSFATPLISFTGWGTAADAFGSCPGRATDGSLYTTENTNVYSGNGDNDDRYKVAYTTYALIRVKVTPTALVNNGGTAETDGTFYYGLSDYKFYDNAQDAANVNGTNDNDPETNGTVGGNGYLKYKEGHAYYTVWVGQNYPTVNYAPVVRNRYYKLNVTKILQLGTPYDPINPLNPKVPYTPGTDGPNTPPTPPDPNDPIVPQMHYIAAQLQVMNWTAVERDIELQK